MTIPTQVATAPRLAYLDATRAFALLVGVGFHASLSFLPFFMGWAVQDISTSPFVAGLMLVSHSFRMPLFFLLAGFFSQGLLERHGVGSFVRSRAVRLGSAFIVGWFVLRPCLVSGWIMGAASMRGDYDFWAAIRGGFATLAQLPAGLWTGTHLWFLYYLLLVTALLLGVRLVVIALTRTWSGETGLTRLRDRVDAGIGWVARSDWGLLVMIAVTAAAVWEMRFWGLDTPDQTLRPHWPVLAVYGGCFGLGWLLARSGDAISHFSRLSALRLGLLAVSLFATLKLSPIQSDPGHPQYATAHAAFVVSYATLMWVLVLLTIGVMRKLCNRPNATIRYVADSSYWMYLIHLPVVVWLQVAVAEVPVHWSLKLSFVTVATVAIALLTYDLFVRSTWVGQILNGRRRARVLGRSKPHDAAIARADPSLHSG